MDFRDSAVFQQLREVFSSDAAVEAWLLKPDKALGGKTPTELLKSEDGRKQVEALVLRMVHGVPS